MTHILIASCFLAINSMSLMANDETPAETDEKRLIEVVADDTDEFVYEDDYETSAVKTVAYFNVSPDEVWQRGALTSRGPHRWREITYHFRAERLITSARIEVEQKANRKQLGSRNYLEVSNNGLDWAEVASSEGQEPSTSGWQDATLTYEADDMQPVGDGRSFWLRLRLYNNSGVETRISNRIEAIRVRLTLGETGQRDPAQITADARKARWNEAVEEEQWPSHVLLASSTESGPVYIKWPDGRVYPLGEGLNASTSDHDQAGFMILRRHLFDRPYPTDAWVYLECDSPRARGMAQIELATGRDASRRLAFTWRGETLREVDLGSFDPGRMTVYLDLPAEGAEAGDLARLGIQPQDSGEVLVKRITVAGDYRPATRPAAAADASLELVAARYEPDPLPPADSQVVEGRTKATEGLQFGYMQSMYRDHVDFGALYVTVRNTSSGPVQIDRVDVNGRPVEDRYVDFVSSEWDTPGIVWYRVRPRVLEPGAYANVYIRFRKRLAGQLAQVAVHASGGAVARANVSYAPTALQYSYITTDASRQRMYIYLKNRGQEQSPPIDHVSLNGTTLENVTIHGESFSYADTALIVADLPEPLNPRSRHTLLVRSGDEVVASEYTHVPFFYPRSSIHVHPDEARDLGMNLVMWNWRPFEALDEHDIDGTMLHYQLWDRDLSELHERIRYAMAPDEPDAHDDKGGGHARGLGWHGRQLMETQWGAFVDRFLPNASTWVIINGTVRPLNWNVYGQLADIGSFDPYPINYYGAEHVYVRESLLYAGQCIAPARLYACLEAYGWEEGGRNRRGPLPAEYRQNVVQAIGSGAKGLTSWVRSPGSRGWAGRAEAEAVIREMNLLIAEIEELLLLGVPVDTGTSDAGRVLTGTYAEKKWEKERVWVGAILCGPDAMVVAAANHIPASVAEPPDIVPAEDVRLSVQLPDYLQNVNAFEVTSDGLLRHSVEIENGAAHVHVDRLESGRVFVLKRQ